MVMRLQDIAKLAGVSPSTVSRVFSNNPRISPAVRSRVLELAAQYDYHPRLSPRDRNIVILIPDAQEYPAHYCVEMLVMALSAALSAANFRVEMLPWNNRSRLEKLQFYGAAAVGLEASELADWPEHFVQPLVVLDREMPDGLRGVWQVSSDEYQCMELAAEHFRAAGRKRVGVLIYGTKGRGNSELRMAAAKAALMKFGFPHEEGLFAYASEESSVAEVGRMLQRKVDALLCPGHSGGLLTAYALQLFNKRIPEDIALISSEICFYSPYAIPPQTTFCPDYPRLARAAAAVFNAVLWGKKVPVRTIVPCRLLARASVR